MGTVGRQPCCQGFEVIILKLISGQLTTFRLQ